MYMFIDSAYVILKCTPSTSDLHCLIVFKSVLTNDVLGIGTGGNDVLGIAQVVLNTSVAHPAFSHSACAVRTMLGVVD